MLSGHVIEDGTLSPTYEFRHLTFQEYLVAKAVVEGHYPDRVESPEVLSVLEPFLEKDTWKEIVPLAAVLAGRHAQWLIGKLIEKCQSYTGTGRHRRDPRVVNPGNLLCACLADEIQAPPDLLEDAMRNVMQIRENQRPSLIGDIRSTRYGEMLFAVAKDEFKTNRSHIMDIGGNLLQMFGRDRTVEGRTPISNRGIARIDSLLKDDDPLLRALACLMVMEAAFVEHGTRIGRLQKIRASRKRRTGKNEPPPWSEWFASMVQLYTSPDFYVNVCALWAMVWLTHIIKLKPDQIRALLPSLISIWRNSEFEDAKYLSSWLISSLPLINRAEIPLQQNIDGLGSFLESRIAEPHRFEKAAALVTAYYAGTPWSVPELKEIIEKQKDEITVSVQAWHASFLALLEKQEVGHASQT